MTPALYHFSLTAYRPPLLESCSPASLPSECAQLIYKSEQLLHSIASIISVEWNQDPNLGLFLSKYAKVPQLVGRRL